MQEMSNKEKRERSAELSRKGFFVIDDPKPTNILVIKQKVTINKDYKPKTKLAKQQK